MSWSVERSDLMMPRLDLVVRGTLRLVSSGGGVIWALHVASGEREDLGEYAVYWERNASPPEMRFIALERDSDGCLCFGRYSLPPLPPR